MDAGSLIRQARRGAGLSQTELGRRAGVAQSVVSAYESRRREPALSTLQRLVEASGHDLVVSVTPTPRATPMLPNTRLGRRLRRKRRAVVERLAQSGATNPMVFGSVARGEEHPDSDIDLLVVLAADVGLVRLAGLTRELTEILGVDVDVVPESALRADIHERVMREAIPL